MSSDIAELLKYGIVTLTLDMLPDSTLESLTARIETALQSQRGDEELPFNYHSCKTCTYCT